VEKSWLGLASPGRRARSPSVLEDSHGGDPRADSGAPGKVAPAGHR